MKRILWVLALALVLFSACKKKQPTGFSEPLVVGYWVCTESDCNGTKTYNPPLYVRASKDHKIRFYEGSYEHGWYWELKGDKLIVTSGTDCPEITLKSLDNIHLSWEKDWFGEHYVESYTKIGALLPGNWRVTHNGIGYTVIIKADDIDSGTAIWKKNDAGSMLSYNWSMSSGERHGLYFQTQASTDDLPTAFSVPFNSVSDNIIKGELNTYEIVFERQ